MAELETLNIKTRKVEDMYERVFSEAVTLGREVELFGMSKEDKESMDRIRAYHLALDDEEMFGDKAETKPSDFFVSL